MATITHRYTVTAKDRGDAERQRRAADALIGALVREPRTQRLFAELRRTTGLTQHAAALRRAMARRAARRTLARVELALLRTLQDQATQHRLMTALDRYVTETFGRRHLELASVLLRYFLRDLAERAYSANTRQEGGVTFQLPESVPPLLFAPPLDMSAAERRRLGRESLTAYERALHHLGAFPRRGRRPKVGAVERDAGWYFRHVRHGVPIQELAEEYHATAHPETVHDQHVSDHSLIIRGIKETARLLSLPLPRRKNRY